VHVGLAANVLDYGLHGFSGFSAKFNVFLCIPNHADLYLVLVVVLVPSTCCQENCLLDRNNICMFFFCFFDSIELFRIDVAK